MEFAIPYILFIFALGVLAFVYESHITDRQRRGVVALSVAMLVLFFGLRGFCFYDWMSYYPAFLKLRIEDLQQAPVWKWKFEPGFTLLMLASKTLVNSYHFFVFVCTTINTVLLLRFLRRYVANIPLALAVTICMYGFMLMTDLMRNSIALLIFINAMEFIKQRRPLAYFSSILVAFTFHLSALIYLPLYFVLHRRWSKWVYAGVFTAGNAIYLLHIPIFLGLVSLVLGFVSPDLQWKVKAYTEIMTNDAFRLSIGYLERLGTGVLIFLYIDKLRQQRPDADMFINSMVLYFGMFFFFSEFKTVSLRMSLLFSYAYWILWIDMIRCFAVQNNRRLFVGFLSIYCLFKIWGSTNNVICKYDNLLTGIEPYHLRAIAFERYFNE